MEEGVGRRSYNEMEGVGRRSYESITRSYNEIEEGVIMRSYNEMEKELEQ